MNKTVKWRTKMIPQVKKILYATDLSKNSEYAFYYSVDLAKKYGGEIVILHAVEPIPSRAAFGTHTDKVYHGQQKESLEVIRKRLQRFCEIVEEKNSLACVNLVTKTIVEVGYPAEEILKTADAEGCDLIVLGTHGKGFLRHAFLGSVSRSVLERARKPVFIVPLPSERTSIWDEM
jgi:nucleotide-binding universal stress UspA family protein